MNKKWLYPLSVFYIVIISLLATSCKPKGEMTTRYSVTKALLDGEQMKNSYRVATRSPCGGFPQLYIETIAGYCAGLLFAGDSSFTPRDILPVPGKNGHYLISNLSNRNVEGGGHIEYLVVNPSTKDGKLTRVISNLTIPHALKLGPNNTVFISLDSKVVFAKLDDIFLKLTNPSFDVPLETAIDQMPALIVKGSLNSLHPMAYFTFDKNFNLFVNVGSFLDACGGSVQNSGKECLTVSYEMGDNRDDVSLHGSVVRMYKKIDGSMTWDKNFKVVAKGLRNSMGLTFAKNGDLIQVENGRDFSEAARPYEELNIIEKSVIDKAKNLPSSEQLNNKEFAHYGWPYCYDHDAQSPEWEKSNGYVPQFDFSCKSGGPKFRYQPPYIMLPPHGAPLDVDYYRGNDPEFNDHLLVALHGYRFPGHRVLAFPTYASGPLMGLPVRTQQASYSQDDPTQKNRFTQVEYRPFDKNKHTLPFLAQHKDLITGWFKSKGFRPQGAPSSIDTDFDGSILIPSDKNGIIVRLSRLGPGEIKLAPAPQQNWVAAYTQFMNGLDHSDETFSDYLEVRNNLLKKTYCEGCHDNYIHPGDFVSQGVDNRLLEMRYLLSIGSWIEPGEAEKSSLYKKVFVDKNSTMPPPDKKKISQWDENFETNKTSLRNWINALPKFSQMYQVKNQVQRSINIYLGDTDENPCTVNLSGPVFLAIDKDHQGARFKLNLGKNTTIRKECGLNENLFIDKITVEPMLD